MIRPRSQRHLLVQGGTVLTQDATRRVLEADVLITDGVIIDVARGISPPSPTRLLAAEGMAVLPGLIQPRALLEHALLRGIEHSGIGDLPHDDASAFWSARLGAVECLRSGITTIAGFAFSRGHDGMRRAIEESGIRAIYDASTGAGSNAEARAGEDPETWLEGATRGNAKRLGVEGTLGSLEPGKAGDLVVVDVGSPESFSHPDATWPFRIQRSLSRGPLRWVVVDGEVLVDTGRLFHLDVDSWTQPAQAAARKLLERAQKGS